MDSLEARLQFIQVIKGLHKTLSVNKDLETPGGASNSSKGAAASSVDPVQFYLRNFEQHHEDFHQCLFDLARKMDSLDTLNVFIYYCIIISTLEKSRKRSPNNRLLSNVLENIMIPDLDKLLVVCLPAKDWKSLTNLETCTKTLCQLIRQINYEDGIKFQEFESSDLLATAPENFQDPAPIIWYDPNKDEDSDTLNNLKYNGSIERCYKLISDRRVKKARVFDNYAKFGDCHIDIKESQNAISSQVILQRMENDRESHKRMKENMWVVERSKNLMDSIEFEKLWHSSGNSRLSRNDVRNIKQLELMATNSYGNLVTKPV